MAVKPTYEELKQRVKKLEQEVAMRKQAEKALRESEHKRNTHLQNTPIGAISWDLNFRAVEWNPAAEAIFGYSKAEAMGKHATELILPEDIKEMVDDIFRDLISEKGGARSTNENLTKDGSRIICDWYNTNLKDADGNVIGVASLVHDITNRKQSEEVLRTSEKEYRSTLNNLLIGVVVHANDTSILFSNPEATNILGLTYEQMSGKKTIDPSWNFVHEDLTIVKVAEYPVSIVFSTKKPLYDYVFGINRPDRDYITWVIVNAIPVFVNDSALDKVIVNFVDITALKQAETAIKKSESMQSKMVANIGDVIVIIDQDGINRYKSPNVEKLFGWKTEDVVGASTWDNVHPEDLESIQKFFGTLMHDPNAVGTTECRYKCKDGSYRWIEFTGNNLLNDPDIRGILGNYHDITDRKQAEKSLRESEVRFKALHNASFGGIAIHDKGIILECNQGLSEITGYSVTELIGMDGLLLIAEKSRSIVMNNIVTGYEKPYEATGLRKNGEEFPIRIEARNIPYKGKTARTVEFRDITGQKLAEEEREKLQAQLTQSQKMESIGTLAGGIAHDFNNILSGIFGFSQLAQKHMVNNPEKAEKDIEQVLEGARKATELVQQILTFSRKSTHKKQPLAIFIVIKEALKLLRASIPTTIEIKETIVSKATVMADPTKIHQIIMNLCTNAYHAMLETGGVLAVGLREVDFSQKDCIPGLNIVPGRYLKLEVSDTGIGMESTTMEKIFEPYFTTKTPDKGTGLGLAVVFGIIEEHNGYIKVYSEPEQGSTFHIYFPIIEKTPDPYIMKKGEESPKSGSETILFVDDDKAVLNSIQALLQELGYTIIPFSDGKKALEAYKKNPDRFDLVITDMTMPGITGLQLAKKILKLQPEQPVVLCTGHSELINREKALATGISEYFEKPVLVKELSKVIRTVLDEAKGKAQQ